MMLAQLGAATGLAVMQTSQCEPCRGTAFSSRGASRTANVFSERVVPVRSCRRGSIETVWGRGYVLREPGQDQEKLSA
jgi:hypothetical protein